MLPGVIHFYSGKHTAVYLVGRGFFCSQFVDVCWSSRVGMKFGQSEHSIAGHGDSSSDTAGASETQGVFFPET